MTGKMMLSLYTAAGWLVGSVEGRGTGSGDDDKSSANQRDDDKSTLP